MSSISFHSSKLPALWSSGITTRYNGKSPRLGSGNSGFWSPSPAIQSQPGHGTSLTSLGLMSLVVKCRDWMEVANWWQMCLVWLTKYFKHIWIGCQYLKIGQCHSKSQISSTSGELKRWVSWKRFMERPWGNYSGSPLEEPAPLPHLLGLCRYLVCDPDPL